MMRQRHRQRYRQRHRGRWYNHHWDRKHGEEEPKTLAQERKEFQKHLWVFAIMGVFFFAVDMLTGPPGLTWFYWPLLGWGIGLVFHFLKAYVPAFYDEEQEAEARQKQAAEEDLSLPPLHEREKELELRETDKKWDEQDLV